MDMQMPFGKHKGEYLSDLPYDYLAWLLDLDNLRPLLRRAVEEEWAARRGDTGEGYEEPPPHRPAGAPHRNSSEASARRTARCSPS